MRSTLDISPWFVDTRWIGGHGIGRFASEVLQRLPAMRSVRAHRNPAAPADPVRLAWSIYRNGVRYFFSPGYNGPVWMSGKFVLTLHDLNHLDVPENTNFFKKAYFSSVVLASVRRASRVLTVSNFSRRRLIEWSGLPPEFVVNVGNGVGKQFVCDGQKYDPGIPYMLYVGNRKPHKNIWRMLCAFSSVKCCRDIRLFMTGDEDSSLLTMISKLGLRGRCICLGVVRDEELAALYRGAVALLFSSLYEGFGLPIVEAMACGVPVVTSNCSGMVEVAGDGAVLVDPYSVESIADGIRRVAEDSALRQELREKGLARVRLFSWDATAEKVQSALDAVIAEGGV